MSGGEGAGKQAVGLGACSKVPFRLVNNLLRDVDTPMLVIEEERPQRGRVFSVLSSCRKQHALSGDSRIWPGNNNQRNFLARPHCFQHETLADKPINLYTMVEFALPYLRTVPAPNLVAARPVRLLRLFRTVEKSVRYLRGVTTLRSRTPIELKTWARLFLRRIPTQIKSSLPATFGDDHE